MSVPNYHRGAPAQLRSDRQRMQEIEAQLKEKFTRWEALEGERAN
jgi:hypothetical protein